MHALIFDEIKIFLLRANVEFAALKVIFSAFFAPKSDAPFYPTSLRTPVLVVTFREIMDVDLQN